METYHKIQTLAKANRLDTWLYSRKIRKEFWNRRNQ